MDKGQNNIEVSPIKAGLRCKCPVCKDGHLFKSYLKVADRCDNCGADLSREDSGDGTAPFIMIFVGFIVAFLAVYTELKFDPPFWLQMIIWIPISTLLTLGLLQPLKGVMINLQFHHGAKGATAKDVDQDLGEIDR